MTTTGMGSAWAAALAAAALAATGPGLEAQELADFDYEHLSFRGVGLDVGWLMGNNVESTYTINARFDLGYLGPGLRIVPRLGYWSSDLAADEVRKLEGRVRELVERADPDGGPAPVLDLSPIEWSDVVIGLDGHVVWNAPGSLLGYLGAGASAHVLNGQGPVVDGTFVEDLLDSIRAGINIHGGLEVAAHENFRIYTEGRGEVLGDLQYAEVRLGGQLFVGPAPPGEEEDRR